MSKWLEFQASSGRKAGDAQDTAEKSRELMRFLAEAMRKDPSADIGSPAWAPVRDLLGEFSERRSKAGYYPSETATFVFSLKQPIFSFLRQDLGKDPDALTDAMWQ